MTSEFTKQLVAYSRGLTTDANHVMWFFCSFDPDTISEELTQAPQATVNWLKSLMKDAPDSDSDWITVAADHRKRQDELQKRIEAEHRQASLGEGWFLNDMDGAWEVPGFEIPMRRFAVVALREALGFPSSLPAWPEWLREHRDELNGLSLDEWFIQTRPRWFYLLRGGFGYSNEPPFQSNPGHFTDPIELVNRQYGERMNLSQIAGFKSFVMKSHPGTFLNFLRWMDRIMQNRKIANHLEAAIRPFLAANPQSYGQVSCRHTCNHLELLGEVPTEAHINEIKQQAYESLSELDETQLDRGGGAEETLRLLPHWLTYELVVRDA